MVCSVHRPMPTASTRGRRQQAEQIPLVVAHHAETPANPLLPDRCNRCVLL
jgi:hypothetical protein